MQPCGPARCSILLHLPPANWWDESAQQNSTGTQGRERTQLAKCGSSAQRSEELPAAQAKVGGYLDCEAELTSAFSTVPSILRKRLFVCVAAPDFFTSSGIKRCWQLCRRCSSICRTESAERRRRKQGGGRMDEFTHVKYNNQVEPQ